MKPGFLRFSCVDCKVNAYLLDGEEITDIIFKGDEGKSLKTIEDV